MGRGSSKLGNSGMKATNARDINNMNEAQINKELRKAESKLGSAVREYEKLIGGSADAQAMRDAFPLGAGGLTKREAERFVAGLSERELARSRKLVEAIQKRDDAQRRIDQLNAAKDKVKGTNKTVNQINEERAKQRSQNTPTTMKWKTTQKQEITGGVLKPRIIKSGDYEIRGSSRLRVMYQGQEIGVASSLQAAKEIAERHKRRNR